MRFTLNTSLNGLDSLPETVIDAVTPVMFTGVTLFKEQPMAEKKSPKFDLLAMKAAIETAKEEAEKALTAATNKQTKTLREAIADATERRDAAEVELDELTETLYSLVPDERPRSAVSRKSSGGTRTRRSAEQLQGEATEILGMLRAAGKSGVSAQTIRAKFPKLGPSISDFIMKHGGGVKLRREGGKRDGVYFLP